MMIGPPIFRYLILAIPLVYCLIKGEMLLTGSRKAEGLIVRIFGFFGLLFLLAIPFLPDYLGEIVGVALVVGLALAHFFLKGRTLIGNNEGSGIHYNSRKEEISHIKHIGVGIVLYALIIGSTLIALSLSAILFFD